MERNLQIVTNKNIVRVHTQVLDIKVNKIK